MASEIKNKVIEEKWQYYFGNHVDLTDFDEGTKNELRNIFFTGAISMFEIVGESNKLGTNELADIVSDVDIEIREFIAKTEAVRETKKGSDNA